MKIFYTAIAISLFIGCKNEIKKTAPTTSEIEKTSSFLLDPQTKDTLIYSEEKHFKNIRQVTFGGDNAEAYWSFDDSKLIFQSNNKNWGINCDQMFLMDADETFKDKQPPMISTGKGRTTCSYFLPDGKHIVYGSTHLNKLGV